MRTIIHHLIASFVFSFLFVLTSTNILSQSQSDSLPANKFSMKERIITVNFPGEISEPWWLCSKSGKIIYCNKEDIRFAGDSLNVSGSMHNISIIRKDVSFISMRPEANRFRNAFIGSAFVFNILLLSPEKNPGYFIGSGSGKDFIGLSAVNVFFSSLLSLAVGSISASSSPKASVISFDGSESETTWRRIFENQKPKFHLRGLIAVVSSNARKEWQKYYESYGATSYKSTSADDALSTAENLTNINALQSFSMNYSVADNVEIGVGIQTGGIPLFVKTFSLQSANKTIYTTNIISELYTDGYYLLTNYTPFILCSERPIHVRFGAGFGVQSYKTNKFPSYVYSALPLSISQYPFSVILNTNLEYFFDRTLSISLTGEYTINENLEIPSQPLTDYGSKILLVLPGTSINTNTFAVGLTVGLHY